MKYEEGSELLWDIYFYSKLICPSLDCLGEHGAINGFVSSFSNDIRNVELPFSGINNASLAPDRIIGIDSEYIPPAFSKYVASGGVAFPTYIAEMRVQGNDCK